MVRENYKLRLRVAKRNVDGEKRRMLKRGHAGQELMPHVRTASEIKGKKLRRCFVSYYFRFSLFVLCFFCTRQTVVSISLRAARFREVPLCFLFGTTNKRTDTQIHFREVVFHFFSHLSDRDKVEVDLVVP